MRACLRPRLLTFMLLPLGTAVGCAVETVDPAATRLEIYLARHGQTDWNAERRLQGGTDTHLNDNGRKQAEQLSRRLEGVPLDHIYCSALSRSRETAEAVRPGVPLTVLPGLNERKLGKFEGVRLDGSQPQEAEEYDKRSHKPDDALDGGESQTQHFERVAAAVTEIRKRNPSGTILIVGHGGTNQMVLRALLSLSAEQAEAIKQANDELYLIEIPAGGAPRLYKAITEANLSDL